jgi:TonB family protein
MPHALLLSPDDQAVSAITAVLEEMSVTCERPMDGVSAAQKLNSQSFDLVLVDCENLPAAKLIFDVCRRGKNGNNPVPIAIVDGRAGLPTAFRLGAELILTKPVAKDQARTTIRSAVGRVRKDVPTNESVSAQLENATVPGTVAPEEHAHAAAAAASSQLTSFSESASNLTPTSLSTAPTSTLSATASVPKKHASVDAIEAIRALKPLTESSPEPAGSVNSKPKLPLSDDPVLAELERTELEESELAEARRAESQKSESQEQGSRTAQTTPDQPAAKSDASPLSSYQQSQQKNRSPQVALFVLMLAVAGFYAAWTYQPGFRTIVQPQIDRLLTRAVMAPPAASTQNLVKPSTQPAAATVTTPASATALDASSTPSIAPNSATSSATGPDTPAPTASVAKTSSIKPATTPVAAGAPATSGTTLAVAPIVPKLEASKASDSKPADVKKDTAVATLPDAPLPGESSAIILSSKGAEKRLAHSVWPKYPAEARSGPAQGTVVLKEVVDETGKVKGVRLVEGNPALATAAISAVKQWRYRPYERDGKTQPFQTIVIIDFQRP